jgi:glyoxylase-like metal-dependent hydrolase (beta-lactamase superfamily II)
MIKETTMNRRDLMIGTSAVFTQLIFHAAPSVAQSPLAGQGHLSTFLDGGFSIPVAGLSRGRSEQDIKVALQSAGVNADAAQSVMNVSLLKRGEDIILFDCGSGPNFVPGTGKLLDALKQQGVEPEKVTHVIFSHGHPDHLWGALDDFDTPAFANAKHYFPQVEWDYWFGADIYSKLPEDRHSFAAGAQRVLKILQSDLKMFKAGEEFVSGIAAIATPGHTPGHMAFEMASAQGPILIGADAVTHPVISFNHPDWQGAFDEDGSLAAQSRQMLLSKAAKDKSLFVGYHLPNGGTGRVEAKGGAYRFIQM